MAQKKFLYFLTNNQGQSYWLQNGVLATRTIPIPIPNNPGGWKEQSIKYARNATYNGLFPTYTIPLKFVRDGAKILRELLYSKGQEETCFLIILRFNSLIGEYESYYKGEIDFSKANDNKDFFEVPVTETGFYKALKAFENTDFEFDFDDDEVIDIEIDGIDIKSTLKYIVPKLSYANGAVGSADILLPFSFTTSEGTFFNLVTGDSPFVGLSNLAADLANDDSKFVLKNTVATPFVGLNLKGSLSFIASSMNYKLDLYFTNGISDRYVTIIPSTPIVAGSMTFNIDVTFNLNGNERLYFVQRLSSAGNAQFFSYNECNFNYSVNSRYKTTYVKAFTPLILGQKILNKLTNNGGYILQSDVLSSSRIVITSGDQIRGITSSKAKVKWKDFFSAMHRNLAIGMSVDEENKVVTISHKSTFYQNNIIYNLGEVVDCSFEVDESYLSSTIKIGYPNQEYDDVNGKDEFNNTHTYTTGIKRSTKDLDITHTWRADPYGIEFLRINLEGKNTTDSKSDNNIFLIDVVPKTGAAYSASSDELGYSNSSFDLKYKNTNGIGFNVNTQNTEFTYTRQAASLTITGNIRATTNNATPYWLFIIVNGAIVNGYNFQSSVTSNFSHTQLFNTGDTVRFTINAQVGVTNVVVVTPSFQVTGISLYKLNRPTYTSITGVISPTTIFNTELSPKRLLLKHQAFIAGMCWGLQGKELTFQSTEKNASLSTTIGGITITENANVPISSLQGQYFYPITVKFKAQVPAALLTILSTNAYGVFQFTYLGNSYTGYLIECSQKPSGNEAQEFTLLLSSTNNLKNLIHG